MLPKCHPKYPPDQNNSYAIKHFYQNSIRSKTVGGWRDPAGMWGVESSDAGALLIEERGRGQLAYIWRNKLIYARKDIKEIFTRLKKPNIRFSKICTWRACVLILNKNIFIIQWSTIDNWILWMVMMFFNILN